MVRDARAGEDAGGDRRQGEREAKRIAGLPEVRERLNALGAEPASGSPAEVGALLKSEMERWAKLIKEQNIKVE